MATEEDLIPSSSYGRTHRFLSLPAARPCTDVVSVQSLLRAILPIANEITNRWSPTSKKDGLAHRIPIHSHRRAVQKAVHVARLLLAFLEELHCSGQHDNLLVPVLGELYVVLQKLSALLNDCTLRGASILLLMNTQRVVREFRAFHESVATAVDSLLLPSINTAAGVDGGDVVELAELAARLARKTAKDVVATEDPEVDRAARYVRDILEGFERGVAPRRKLLRHLLDYLGIQTWVDCDSEAAFLQGQIELAAADAESVSSSCDLLHGLRGLMLYARAVLFNAAKSASVTQAGTDSASVGSPSSSTTELAWLDPKDLRCPISLNLMTDPVTVSTGQTYSRSSIIRWLRSGNLTCPVTGKDLSGATANHQYLVPNLAVRNVIQRFCQARGVPVSEQRLIEKKNKRAATAGSSNNKAASGAMRLAATYLVEQYSNSKDSPAAICSAVQEARLLAKSGASARAALADAGAVPWLLHLLASRNKRVQDDAAAAVMNLSKHPQGRKEVFASSGLVCLVDLLGNDAGASSDSQANAAGALFYLASANEEYRVAIGEEQGAFQGLIDMLKAGTHRGKKHALTAISALLVSPVNHAFAIAAGAIPALIGLVAKAERDDIVAEAVAAIAGIVGRPQGVREFVNEPNGVRSLVEVLRSSVTAAAKECCMTALTALCKNGGAETVKYLNSIPTLMPSLYTLLTQSSPAASKKSSYLIKIIHRGHGDANVHLRFPASTALPSPVPRPQLARSVTAPMCAAALPFRVAS